MNISGSSISIKILVPIFILITGLTLVLFLVIFTTDHRVSIKYFEQLLSQRTLEIKKFMDTAIAELVSTQLLDNSFVVEAKQKVTVEELQRYWRRNGLMGAILDADGNTLYSSLAPNLMGEIKPLLARGGHFHIEEGLGHTNGQIFDFPVWKWKVVTVYPPVNWIAEIHQKELIYLIPVVLLGMAVLMTSVFVVLRKNFQQPVLHILGDLRTAERVSTTGISELDTIVRAINEAFEKRRQVEDEIRQINLSLEEKVRQRTAELTAANQELESFAYSVSHDLRAPLRSIDGFSQALLEDYNERLDDEGRDLLSRVRKASQKMGHLIDDMLKLSRVTRTELVLESVDLSAMAEEIVAGLREAEPARSVDVMIRGGVTARGDERMLRIVLENLLGNAWKFTGKTDGARIELGVDARKNIPVYFVKDNGAGFDMAYAGKLFGTFQRLHREQEFPGTGVGLATVQRIVRRHGGDIRAESEPGRGATFYFTIGAEAEK